MIERFEIKQFDLEFEKNMQTQFSFVEIHDTYLRYAAQYDSEVPNNKYDLSLGWKATYYDFDLRVKRKSFISVEKWWIDKFEYWKLELEIEGYPNTINIHYRKEQEKTMLEVFEKLFKWVFNL